MNNFCRKSFVKISGYSVQNDIREDALFPSLAVSVVIARHFIRFRENVHTTYTIILILLIK